MEYEKSRDVSARPDILWRALTSVTEWPEWTGSITQIVLLDGSLGADTRVRIQQPGLRTMTYQVDDWEPGSGFHWSASMLGLRIGAGHEVTPVGSGSRLRLTIAMSGPIAALMAPLTGARIRSYVDMEADGMRRFAEHLASGFGPAAAG